MESVEDAARDAANRWNARKDAKAEVRQLAEKLLETKTMTETATIIGISRTSLYYFLYGRDGKNKSARRANEASLPVHDGDREFRESA